jgi:hypothetical protein
MRLCSGIAGFVGIAGFAGNDLGGFGSFAMAMQADIEHLRNE